MPQSSKLSRFWREIKRRNVLRSLAIYAGTAFIILEACNMLFPRWDLPDWTFDLVFWLLVLGAFINLIIAWFYDITPGGMQRTLPLEDALPREKARATKGWKAATYSSIVVIVALIVLNAIGGPSRLRAGDITSIAILPFDNFTGDDELEYFVSGMQASLINDMGKLSGLRIISKTSASVYKDKDLTASEIARKLKVDAVVEGSIMCLGDTICSQFRLVSTSGEEKQIWNGDYKEEKSQVLNLFNRITKQIANEVKVQLTPSEVQLLAESKRVNPDAYDAYLRGLYYWDQFTAQSLQMALEYFNKAIEIDPDWAPPHAGIAYYWIAIRQFGLAPASITVPMINNNLSKAFRLDPNSANTQYVSALASVWTAFDWKKGEQEFLKVLEINPNDAFSHVYYAHLLASLKRDREAIKHCETALDLDPLNPMILGLGTMVLAFTGEYERAIETGTKAMAISPGNGAAVGGLYFAYFLTERYQKGFETWMIALPLDEETKIQVLEKNELEGVVAAADHLSKELEKQDPFLPLELATACILANNSSKAMDWLEKGYENHDANIPYIGLKLFSQGLFKIDNPRYYELLKKMDLPLPL